MLNFVENLLENERDPRSGPMNDQDHSLSLSDPDRSLVLSHFLTNFLQNLASCHTAFRFKNMPKGVFFSFFFVVRLGVKLEFHHHFLNLKKLIFQETISPKVRHGTWV
jgi:hypothetical protein